MMKTKVLTSVILALLLLRRSGNGLRDIYQVDIDALRLKR
jgi:hypothetical protein